MASRVRSRRFLEIVTVALCVLVAFAFMGAGTRPAQAAAASATASTTSQGPDCHGTTCRYEQPGQALFDVPTGVSLLHAEVVSSAPKQSPSNPHRHAGTGAKGPAAPAPQAGCTEVAGYLAVPTGAAVLEVSVGGSNSLGGTTSEVQTSTAAASKVLIAAMPAAAARDRTAPAHGGDRRTSEAQGDIVPPGGTKAAASCRAGVSLSWQPAGTAPRITSSGNLTFAVGTAGAATVTAVAPTPPAITEAGPLPQGLVLRDNGNGTATLEGTPTAVGTYEVTVSAAGDTGPAATQPVAIVVAGASAPAAA